MRELQFQESAAAGYDQHVGLYTKKLIPTLLRMVCLFPGQRLLDIASGTGLAAEAAAKAVGPSGHVVATDISPMMLEKARERLGISPIVTFAIEDGQSLTLADESFDAVICNMGLMYFPEPARGLSEFRRVLRVGGRAAVSVFQSPSIYCLSSGRELVGGAVGIIGRHVPSKAAENDRYFAVGYGKNLESLFTNAGFDDFEAASKTVSFELPSFDTYVKGVEQGAGSAGQDYLALPNNLRLTVRDEMRALVNEASGPVEIKIPVRFGVGRR